MLSKLLPKKKSPKSKPEPKDAASATPPPLDADDSADEAYSEQPTEDAHTAKSASSDAEHSERAAPDSPPAKGKKTKPRKGSGAPEVATSAEVENPRALIAEAVGGQAMTLAKSNTVLKSVALGLSAVCVILSITAAVGWNREIEYRYFFVSNNGTLMERAPLDAPVLSLNNVRDFYAESLSHLFSFHYRNFGDHYQRVAPDIMTEQAMHEFAQELDRIGLIESMKSRQEVAEAVILQTPVLNASGVDPKTGLYTWELSVPFNLRLEPGNGSERSRKVRRMGGVARVQVVRVEPTVHPRQILINRITIRDTDNG